MHGSGPFIARRSALVGGLSLAALVIRAPLAGADSKPSERQLIDALLGKGGGLRSASPPPAVGSGAPGGAIGAAREAAADPAHLRALLDRLEAARTRAFSVKQRPEDAAMRQEIATHVSDRPSVDMEVYFDFNAWKVTPAAAATLDRLGGALASRELASRGFLLEGHTDAKGKPDVNLTISQLRADAVRDYLVARHGINAGLLRSIGYGEERLKVPARPHAAENRRVRVVNLPEGVLSAR